MKRHGPSFEDVWLRIQTLEGRHIPLASRGSNRIIRVDEAGVLRETSSGHVRRMSVESFRWTIQALDRRDALTRAEVLNGIGRWESSGVIATLAATGLYEITYELVVGLRRARI